MKEYTTLREMVEQGAKLEGRCLVRLYSDPCAGCLEVQKMEIPPGIGMDTPIQVGYHSISLYKSNKSTTLDGLIAL